MWTSQVYGHHDKMVRTKTHRTKQNTDYTKTQQTLRNNYFCVFRIFLLFFLFSIFNYLKDFSKKCWITALVRSMKNIGGLNQFSSAANLTLFQHFLDFWFCIIHFPVVLFNSLVALLKRVNGQFFLFLLQKMLKKCEVCCSGKLV